MTQHQSTPDAQLDDWLDAYTVSLAPGDPLVARVLASAPLAATAPAPTRWSWLWPGAGLAGIGLAGSLVGALAVSVTLGAGGQRAAPDWPERLSAFTEPSPDWSEE